MNNLLQIVFDMWRPYYFDYKYYIDFTERSASDLSARWADFVQRAHRDVEAFGDIESIDVEDFDRLFFYGKIPYPPICIFNPWRSSLGLYSDEREEFYKEHPEEPERLRALLRKAEVLLAAQNTKAPLAKLAMA